jgi:membrane protease YdiL (CAAX protease family)
VSAVTRAVGPDASARLRDTARVLLWGLLLYGGVLLVASKLQAKSFGSLGLQMVLAEWGAGRLAVAWSDPSAAPPTYGAIGRRAGRGAAIGLLGAAVVIGLMLATRALSWHDNTPEVGQLAVGLVTAAIVAARDELLFRGILLRAFRNTCGPLARLLVCGGAAVAAEYGALAADSAPSRERLLIAGLLGVAFASLWLVDRGGWLPLGAHAAWTTATGVLVRGGVFDLRPAMTAWGGGDAGVAASLATVTALVPLVLVAAAWALRSREAAVEA